MIMRKCMSFLQRHHYRHLKSFRAQIFFNREINANAKQIKLVFVFEEKVFKAAVLRKVEQLLSPT